MRQGMPHVPSEDMDMTTKTVTENMSSTEAIQTPKRFGLQLLYSLFTLLCDGADLGFGIKSH